MVSVAANESVKICEGFGMRRKIATIKEQPDDTL